MAKTRMSSKFNRCVKSVRRTVRARKGSNKESAAIAICTKTVLQKRGRTMKSYSRRRLITQKKFRGGATPDVAAKQIVAALQADVGQMQTLPHTVDISHIENYADGIQYIMTKLNSWKPSLLNMKRAIGSITGTNGTGDKVDGLKEDLQDLLDGAGKMTITSEIDRKVFTDSVKTLATVSL